MKATTDLFSLPGGHGLKVSLYYYCLIYIQYLHKLHSGIAPGHNASFSLVAGKFTIGIVDSMTCCLYLRRQCGLSAVLRTTDFDHFDFNLDGSNRIVSLKGKSLIKGIDMELNITSTDQVTHLVHIPTAYGFSNNPGCRESYTATAIVKLRPINSVSDDWEEYIFPLSALEFGGSFVGEVVRGGRFS